MNRDHALDTNPKARAATGAVAARRTAVWIAVVLILSSSPARSSDWDAGDRESASQRSEDHFAGQLLFETSRTRELQAAALSSSVDPAPLSSRSSRWGRRDATGTTHDDPDWPLSEGSHEEWTLQLLPMGLLFQPYLAGEKEPRFALQTLHQSGRGWIWEASLGARLGLVRNGTVGVCAPEGWQLDIEGAAMPRLDLQQKEDVDSVDFRFGVPLTYRAGQFSQKAGYYHISSHLGDEFMLKHPESPRVNYVRESLIYALSFDLDDRSRVYGEIGYAFSRSGGAAPLEFQFGAEYGDLCPGAERLDSPFIAANLHLRQDFGMNGSINLLAGWQWRGRQTNHIFRVGLQYYRGRSMQYEFFNQREELIGTGTWLDF